MTKGSYPARGDDEKIHSLLLILMLCISVLGCSGANEDDTIRLQGEFYQSGHDEGFTAGYSGGYDDGYSDGYTDGHQIGSLEAERKAALTIDTPYYTIELPDEWYGTFEIRRDDSLGPLDPDGSGIGGSVSIMQDGYATFFVPCCTDNWGPQGTFFNTRLGAPSNLSGYYVCVSHAMTSIDGAGYGGENKSAEYAQYVTVK